jgi:hypothetical protein
MSAPKSDKRRAERLAAALKANLKRRKAQARGRAGEGRAEGAPADVSADRPHAVKADRDR